MSESVFTPPAIERRGEGGSVWPRNVYATAEVAALVVKSGAGKLYGFSVYNSNAAKQYVLLFDRSGIPADGQVPAMVFPVAGDSTLLVSYGDTGRTFDGGCVLANSSTAASLTAGSADCWFDVQFL